MGVQFTADHEAFREAARGVLEREVVPRAQEWEEAGAFPAHRLFKALGTAGHVTTGGVLSITLKVVVHVALLPAASVAVTVIVVVPEPTSVPAAGD